jgi:predicted nucleic acid-binding protein
MTVIFDAESLLAFSFDEQGAGEVERWLDRVYDGELDGYISTVNLAEFRYIATRKASAEQADAWEAASDLKAAYSPSIGDAYAVAAAKDLDNDDERNVTLLVSDDDDYDVFEDEDGFKHLIERFRDEPA